MKAIWRARVKSMLFLPGLTVTENRWWLDMSSQERISHGICRDFLTEEHTRCRALWDALIDREQDSSRRGCSMGTSRLIQNMIDTRVISVGSLPWCERATIYHRTISLHIPVSIFCIASIIETFRTRFFRYTAYVESFWGVLIQHFYFFFYTHYVCSRLRHKRHIWGKWNRKTLSCNKLCWSHL